MYGLAKSLILPPFDIWVVEIVGIILLLRGHQRSGIATIILSAALLYVLSIPAVGDVLGRAIEIVPPLHSTTAISNAGAIVVFSGGARRNAPEYGGETVDRVTLERLRYAVHLYRATGLPLLVSGGQLSDTREPIAAMMKVALESDFQVPVRWVEDRSQNTFENAIYSAEILRKDHISSALLVTDAGSMARALDVFNSTGLSVIPAPTGFTGPSRIRVTDFIPQFAGIRDSYYALYEIFGRAWYSIRYTGTEVHR